MQKVWALVAPAWYKNVEGLSSLLDSELAQIRRTMMKSFVYLAAALIIAGLFFLPAYAFTIPFTDIKLFEDSGPVNNRAAPASDSSLQISFVHEDASPVDTLTRIIGISKGGNVTVKEGDTTLAVLPQGSKFENVPVTSRCLVYQYGTDGWYSCEVGRT